MRKKERFAGVVGWFEQNVPLAATELHYRDPFQLLVAVILSAQCTDKRVNLVTPALFERFPDAASLAAADFDSLYPYIKSVSYPNSKTRHLIGMAQKLLSDFGGEVPSEISELMTLPGVGRKTANVIASVVFDQSVIAVDTHVFRVSHRLGLSDGSTPRAVELDLEQYIQVVRACQTGYSCLTLGLTPWTFSHVIGAYFNRYMITDKKFTVDADTCLHCGLCAKVCPVGDIVFDGIPSWKNDSSCTCCLSCYHHCPVHAINYGRITRKRGQYYYK